MLSKASTARINKTMSSIAAQQLKKFGSQITT